MAKIDDKELFELHNKVRANPKCLIPDLKEMKKNFEGLLYTKSPDVVIRTVWGVDGVEKAIKFLEQQQPVDKLTFSEEITRACKHHVADIGQEGLHQHDSSDGKTDVKMRLNMYG